MGRAGNSISAAAVAPLARRSPRRAATTLHPEADALWFAHSRDLVEATKLLRVLDQLDDRGERRLLRIVSRVGATAGMTGAWRLMERPDGVFLGYCAHLDTSHPDVDTGEWHVLGDHFTGGTIDGLPEPRYLGRMLQELPDASVTRWVASREETVMNLALAALRGR